MSEDRVWPLLKNWFFKCDAEFAHHLVVRGVSSLADFAPHLLERVSGQLQSGQVLLKPTVFGMPFASALGLAAGFDKNAELVSALPLLGFGFCEIGTVTPLPQLGNAKPRLMRETKSESLFNRMGFNNLGAEQIAKNLSHHRKNLPKHFRVGVNIGKNKETEGASIAKDYALAARPFTDLADFFVINVSSPNTPGLRALQAQESLEPIIDAVFEEISLKPTSSYKIPVLVKLAPELQPDELRALISFFETKKISGLVLTNTLAGETLLGPGGWSGGRVRDAAARALGHVRSMTSMPIISVGGIDSPVVAQERIDEGASLLEIYSSWIFKGPRLPGLISGSLEAKLV